MDAEALYDGAVAYVQKRRDTSCSGLQRHLRIGYSMARQLQDRLEKNGVYAGMERHVEPEQVVIKVVGVGGAGCNALEDLMQRAPGVEAIAVNLNAGQLTRFTADKVVPIGAAWHSDVTNPEVANTLAHRCRNQLGDALCGAHIVVVAAGLGGAMGAGAAPAIARIAKDQGALCIGVAYAPWSIEDARRHQNADAAMQALLSHTDSLFIVPPPVLDGEEGEMSMLDLLQARDIMLYEIVDVFAQMFAGAGNMAPSLFDLRGVMGQHGKAMIGTGRASGPDRTRVATELACAALSDRGADTMAARGLLVVVTASRNSRLVKPAHVMAVAASFFASDVSIVMSYMLDDAVRDEIRVNLIATGM
jgi:cell division protein FtsZ